MLLIVRYFRVDHVVNSSAVVEPSQNACTRIRKHTVFNWRLSNYTTLQRQLRQR